MALVAVEIPKIGLVMERVRIARWLKKVGDAVEAGEPLLEVETEKSMVEIEAAVGGRLGEVLAPVNKEVQVGDQVAWMETDAAAASTQPAPSSPPPAAARTAPVAPPREPTLRTTTPNPPPPGPLAPNMAARSALPPSAARAAARLHSSPYARRLAAERGVDLRKASGSGPGGRVEAADVRALLSKGVATQSSPSAASLPAGVALSPMRRALARAMTLSNATVPQFVVERSFNCATLQALRAEYGAAAPAGSARLSVNDFLLQAVARTLIEQPALNATFGGDANSPDARLVPARGAHIGLVVAVAGGLLVPVIHDAEKLGLHELARRRQDCVQRALEGRLRSDELEGATFSISNLGAEGPDRFTAMINPPQSAILAVGRQRDCVVAVNGGFSVRAQSVLTLAVDHRVADGRLASAFLGRLVEILEGRDWRLR